MHCAGRHVSRWSAKAHLTAIARTPRKARLNSIGGPARPLNFSQFLELEETMSNELSFGQRTFAPVRFVADFLRTALSAMTRFRVAREREAYRQALLVLGRRLLLSHYDDAVLREGILALIAACIDAGISDRDSIVRTVGRHHVGSGRLTGRLLTKHTGTDPARHLWLCSPEYAYLNLPGRK